MQERCRKWIDKSTNQPTDRQFKSTFNHTWGVTFNQSNILEKLKSLIGLRVSTNKLSEDQDGAKKVKKVYIYHTAIFD